MTETRLQDVPERYIPPAESNLGGWALRHESIVTDCEKYCETREKQAEFLSL
jgi:hypothetical protein